MHHLFFIKTNTLDNFIGVRSCLIQRNNLNETSQVLGKDHDILSSLIPVLLLIAFLSCHFIRPICRNSRFITSITNQVSALFENDFYATYTFVAGCAIDIIFAIDIIQCLPMPAIVVALCDYIVKLITHQTNRKRGIRFDRIFSGNHFKKHPFFKTLIKQFCCSDKRDVNLAEFHILPERCPLHHILPDRCPQHHPFTSVVRTTNNFPSCSCIGPRPRSGHRIFVCDNYVYVLGGFNPTHSLFHEMWALDVISNRWHKVRIGGQVPGEMASFAICYGATDGRMLVFGGTGVPFGISTSNRAHLLVRQSPLRWEFQPVNAVGDIPAAGYGQAMVCVDRDYYVIGGTTGHEYNLYVWKLSTDRNAYKWSLYQSTVNIAEQGRYRHEVIRCNHLILLFGGGTPQWDSGFENLLAFNVSKGAYETISTVADAVYGFPGARKCHSVVEFEGFIYLIGGCTAAHEDRSFSPNEGQLNVYNDVWRIGKGEWRWQKLATTLKKGVFFHDAAVTKDGCVIVFGGCVDGFSLKRTNAVQRLWIKPPRLEYVAHQKLYGVFPQLFDPSPQSVPISRAVEMFRSIYKSVYSPRI